MAKILKNALFSDDEIVLNPLIIEPEISSSPIEINIEAIQKEAYEQGKIEANRLMAEDLGQLKVQLEQTISSIPQAVAQNRLDLHQEIADILLLIIQQFFIENAYDSHQLSQQINQILAQLNNKQEVELCLHPQDITALQQGLIQLDASHLNGLKIKGDEALALGGYQIKTNHGIFDASIEKQLAKLKDILLQIKSRGPHALVD